jgi:hypothetical protein
VKVMVPVGLKPAARVAASVSLVPLPSITVGPALVVMVGLAGSTVCGSLPGALLTGWLLASPL